MNLIDKEEQRKKILAHTTSDVKNEDFSMFGDEDVDVFEKLVSFDSYQNNIYPTLSEPLKNNRQIAVEAAKFSFNIPSIPKHFFQDKEIIKYVIFNHAEKLIPVEFLTEDIINYMFLTHCPSTLSTKEIRKACDKHLKKESIVKLLLNMNELYSDCKKTMGYGGGLHKPYIPEHFFQDKDILKLVIIPYFELIKDHSNISKEMIIELLDSGYILNELPSKFFNDMPFIKKCLQYEYNYHFLNDYDIVKLIKKNPQLNLELLAINHNVAENGTYPLFFESFKTIFSKNPEKIYLCKRVIKEDEEKLFNYMQTKEVLDFFLSKDNKYDKKYNFNPLYGNHYYSFELIGKNRFIIEEIAKQDKVLFRFISIELVNDDKFMFKLLWEHKVIFDFDQVYVAALHLRWKNSNEFNTYINMLKLEHSLPSKPNNFSAKMKI